MAGKGKPENGRRKRTDKTKETPKAVDPEIVDPDDEFQKPDDEPGLSIGFEEEGSKPPIWRFLLQPNVLILILGLAGMYLIVNFFAVTDGRYTRDITRLELDLVDMREVESTATADINSQIMDMLNSQQRMSTTVSTLQDTAVKESDLSPYATKASLDAYATTSQLDAYLAKSSFDTHKEKTSESLSSIEETMAGMSERITEANTGIDDEADRLDGAIATVSTKTDVLTGKVNDLEIAMGNSTGNHVEYTLVGDNGEYDLSVKSSVLSTYMARMTLLYDPPVTLMGNETEYCEALAYFNDRLDEPNRSYIPTMSWNGVTWGLVQIEVYTSAFTLSADEEVSFSIVLDGLESLPQHSAFIEVLEGAAPAEGGGGSI